jgi:hypothetical protein
MKATQQRFQETIDHHRATILIANDHIEVLWEKDLKKNQKDSEKRTEQTATTTNNWSTKRNRQQQKGTNLELNSTAYVFHMF